MMSPLALHPCCATASAAGLPTTHDSGSKPPVRNSKVRPALIPELQRNVNDLILLLGGHVNESKGEPSMKKGLLVLAASFAMSGFAYAQSGVAGKWTGEQPGRGGAAGTPL